jgi:branched-chain amino acid transport system ATP-binding protein
MGALLEARNVTKRYGNLIAVADVSLELEEGEILGLIGPNGAGKTTLVNVITGTAPGWTGDIRFRGRSLQRLRPYQIGRLGIARSFQIAQPFGAMSLVENVMVGALYGQGRRVHLRAARAASLEILESLDLAEKADLLAESLNAAERKRLEIAKALAMEPALLLLDEVMAGLNAAEVDLAVELIRHVRERGIAIVMIEHVMRAVTQLADRVVVLQHGEKVSEGTPSAVLSDELVISAYLGRGDTLREHERSPEETSS